MPPTYNIEIPDVGYFERQVSCRVGCPVHTDSGGYVQAIAQGRYEDAYIIARQPNPFASICGRVCAAPCEAKCRRGAIDAAISIRDRKSTRLNSSHLVISYAVFCLKKKNSKR